MDRRTAGRTETHLSVSERRWPEPPGGFVLRPEGTGALYVAAGSEGELRARGLTGWTAWERVLSTGDGPTGRGATVVLGGSAGPRWRVKGMRRGGLAASIWRDRYLSAARLTETLAASVEVEARGVPTARPIALIVETGGGVLARGAMAVEEIEGAQDLARRVVAGVATRADLQAALGAVRAMHDRGVVHPDLNLGNILLRSRAGAEPEAFVIDFDRASFTGGPLGFRARQAAVRRLERSCAKLTGAPGALGAGSEDLWYAIYAGADAKLAGSFAEGRRVGRWLLAMHRLGWRRSAR